MRIIDRLNEKLIYTFREDAKSASRTKKTVSLSLASLFNTLISVALSSVMARLLSKVDVATYNQTFLIFKTIAPLLGLGISQGIYYWFPRKENCHRGLFWESIIVLSFTGVAYALFIILGGNQILAQRFENAQLSEWFIWIIPYTVFYLFGTIISPILVSGNCITLNAKYNVFSHLLVGVFTLAAVCIFRTAKAAVIGYAYTYFAVFLIMLICTYLYVIPKDVARPNLDSLKLLLKFSVPLGLSSMVGILDTYADKWIVSMMLSPEEYAIFSIGAQEIPLIGAITGAISTVVMVDMINEAKNKQYNRALILFKDIGGKTSTVLFPIMLFLMIAAPSLIEILFTKEYIDAVPIFRVYLFYLPIRTVVYGAILTAFGKTKEVLYKTIAGLGCNIVLSIVLVRMIGSLGASIGTIVSLYLINVPINLRLISKATGEKWFRILPFKHYGMCLLLALPAAMICAIVSYVLRNHHPLIRLMFECISFFLPCAFIYAKFFKLSWRHITKRVKQIF